MIHVYRADAFHLVCKPTFPNRRGFPESEWKGDSGACLDGFRWEVRGQLHLRNMHMERRLNESKHALPRLTKRRFGETFCYGGLVDRLWRKHMSSGAENPFAVDRSTMFAKAGEESYTYPLLRTGSGGRFFVGLRRKQHNLGTLAVSAYMYSFPSTDRVSWCAR